MADFAWTLAWRDQRLAAACTDVHAGVLGAVRLVLAESRERRQFVRRGFASAVLGSLAASSRLAEQWVREAPRDPDALLLATRVAAQHAAEAYRKGFPQARGLLRRTADLAGRCSAAWQEDPTPFVVVLSLTKFECQATAPSEAFPELVGIQGPWRLAEQEIWTRDPHNREAGRHLLGYFAEQHLGASVAFNVAMSLACRSPNSSVLRLLPLAAVLEHPLRGEEADSADIDRYNRLNRARGLLAAIQKDLGQGTGTDAYTFRFDLEERVLRLRRTIEQLTAETEAKPGALRPAMVRDLVDLYSAWFNDRHGLDYAAVTINDVSLLARGLQLGGEFSRASMVLRQLLPYASTYPWKLAGNPAEVLRAAIAECAGASHLPIATSARTASRASTPPPAGTPTPSIHAED